MTHDEARRLVCLVTESIPAARRVTPGELALCISRGATGHPRENAATLRDLLATAPSLGDLMGDDARWRELVYRDATGRPRRRRWNGRERRRAVVDLSNLVWTFRVKGSSPRLASLLPVAAFLRSLGVEELYGVADANIRHVADDPDALSALGAALDELVIVEARHPADPTIIDTALRRESLIVSNDRYREWKRGSAGKRRAVWRIVVPLRPAPHDHGDAYDLGEPGEELRDPTRRIEPR